MVNLRTRGERIFDVLNVALMVFLAFLFLYPFWHCVALSFGNVAYSNQLGFRMFPFGEFFRWQAIRRCCMIRPY